MHALISYSSNFGDCYYCSWTMTSNYSLCYRNLLFSRSLLQCWRGVDIILWCQARNMLLKCWRSLLLVAADLFLKPWLSFENYTFISKRKTLPVLAWRFRVGVYNAGYCTPLLWLLALTPILHYLSKIIQEMSLIGFFFMIFLIFIFNYFTTLIGKIGHYSIILSRWLWQTILFWLNMSILYYFFNRWRILWLLIIGRI